MADPRAPLDVDGPRPLFALVTALPQRYRMTPGEMAVLMVLAADDFTGTGSAPSLDQIAAWTGMWRSSVIEVIAGLVKAKADRPALLQRQRAGRRTRYVPLFAQPTGEPGHVDAEKAGDQTADPTGHPTGHPTGYQTGMAGRTLPSPSPTKELLNTAGAVSEQWMTGDEIPAGSIRRLNDAMLATRVSNLLSQEIAYLRSLPDWDAVAHRIARWCGAQEAARELGDGGPVLAAGLLEEAGLGFTDDGDAWNRFLAAQPAARPPDACRYEDSGYCDRHGLTRAAHG